MNDGREEIENKFRSNGNIAFSKVESAESLIKYLDHGNRMSNTKFFYHYTTVDKVINIFKSEMWYLGSASGMNDIHEYKCGDKKRWENLFFASFMGEEKESIGMWSMYAQPWEKGVKIEIPKENIRTLINETKEIFPIGKNNEVLKSEPILLDKVNYHVWLSRVAYSNQDNREAKEKITLYCGGEKNTLCDSVVYSPELTGYIKDTAWSYEKEFRIKAQIPNIPAYNNVAIHLSKDFLDSIRIVSSPLFKGNLKEELKKEIRRSCKTAESFFTGKMNYKTPCDKCDLVFLKRRISTL